MYSLERRKLALHVYSLFNSLRKTAKILLVSHSTISRWLHNINRKEYTYKNNISKTSLVTETIKSSILANPLITILSLQNIIETIFHFKVSKELVRVAIKKLGLSRKKARFFGVPKNLEEKTKEFIMKRETLKKQGYTFYSLDETSFGRHGKNIMGYSQKGKPLQLPKKSPCMITTSSLVLVSQDKVIQREERKGSFNSESFNHFLEISSLPRKSAIILDNVRFHHNHLAKLWAEKNDIVLLFCPPYSPWFNPIEGVFSVVKRHFYKNNTIDDCYDQLKKEHFRAFFKYSLEKN